MKNITKTETGNNIALYVHVPFCKSRCFYCNFCSNVTQDESIFNAYFQSLENELRNYSEMLHGKIISSIYIGGGTPSLVPEENIKRLLDCINSHFNVSKDAEITIECNPSTLTKEKVKCYREIGINRVSLGVQSIFKNDLAQIGRIQNFKDVKLAIRYLKKYKIKNISVDMLLGISKQSKFKLFIQLLLFAFWNVKHISAYMLTLEEGTKLYNLTTQNKYFPLNDDRTVDNYNFTYKMLKLLKFNRYEVSNFAKRGFESKHNLVYWQGGDYLGIGESAHSYINGERIENNTSLENYLSCNFDYRKECLSTENKREEFIMLSLRLKKGIDLNKYNQLFGSDLLVEKADVIKQLMLSKIVNIKENYLCIEPNKMGVLNSVIIKLL